MENFYLIILGVETIVNVIISVIVTVRDWPKDNK